MTEVSSAKLFQDQKTDTLSKTSTGSLKIEGKEFSFSHHIDTESVTKGVFDFLTEANLQEMPEEYTFEAIWVTFEEAEQFFDILAFLQELGNSSLEEQESFTSPFKKENGLDKQNLLFAKETATRENLSPSPKATINSEKSHSTATTEKEVFSSLFSLARTVIQARKNSSETSSRPNSPHTPKHLASIEAARTPEMQSEYAFKMEGRERDREGEKEKNDQQDGHNQQNREDSSSYKEEKRRKKNKEKSSPFKVHATRETKSSRFTLSASQSAKSSPHKNPSAPPSIDNIYIRFMALMARILGQAEAEAHDLYQRIKQRTDNVDTLTLLISKINSANGKIDWSKEEEMRALLEKARSIGVDIPQGKFQWTEEEKKAFKDNVQLKKDSLEKITQLERTDMQRFLQEASQCHQARSNILKLLKEVTDTIIANMRP